MGRGALVPLWLCWVVVVVCAASDVVGTVRTEKRYRQLLEEMESREPLPPPPPRWPRPGTSALAGIAIVGVVLARFRAGASERSRCGSIHLEAFALRALLASLAMVPLWRSLDTSWSLGWWFRLSPYLTSSILAITVAYAFARCRSVRAPLADWGFLRGRGVWRELGLGLLAGSLLAACKTGVDLLDPLGTHIGGVPFRLPLFLQAVVAAAVVEEIAYRGMLHSHLRERWGPRTAVLVGSVVFAAFHLPLIQHATWAFVIGVVLALLREWRGSLVAPIAAHAAVNAVILYLL